MRQTITLNELRTIISDSLLQESVIDKLNDAVKNKESEEDAAKKLLAIAKKNLRKIGFGSSRVSYALSSKKVLKIALNSKGYIQNRVEFLLSNKQDINKHVTKVFATAPYNTFNFIISELVRPANMRDIINVTGTILSKFLTYVYDVKNSPEMVEYLTKENKITPQGLELAQWLSNLEDKYDVYITDLYMPEQWGMTSDQKLVVLDTGFTGETSNFYGSSRYENDWISPLDD